MVKGDSQSNQNGFCSDEKRLNLRNFWSAHVKDQGIGDIFEVNSIHDIVCDNENDRNDLDDSAVFWTELPNRSSVHLQGIRCEHVHEWKQQKCERDFSCKQCCNVFDLLSTLILFSCRHQPDHKRQKIKETNNEQHYVDIFTKYRCKADSFVQANAFLNAFGLKVHKFRQ